MSASCDVNSRKIYGCVEGTKDWYHEEGHLIWNDKETDLILRKQFIDKAITGTLIIGCLLLFVSKIVSIVLFLLCFGGQFYNMYQDYKEEKWCNSYAEEKCQTNPQK